MDNVNFENLSFDAVIPSALLFNENIEPSAIKLYAFVRGLSRLHGYCYATNAYLAKCMKCDESTIKRLLVSLKEEGFIEVETDKEGIHWQRRIYVGVCLKESLRRLKIEPPPAQNRAPPSSKMSHNKRYTNADIQKEEPRPSASSSHPEAVNVTYLLIEAIKKTKPDLKDPKVVSWYSAIDRMLRIDKRSLETVIKLIKWLPTSEFWSKNILSAESFRDKFDRLELEMSRKPSNNASDDLQLLKKLEARKDLLEGKQIEIGPNYVEFKSIRDAYFKIGEPSFKDKVLNSLRKLGVPIQQPT